jgi:hypothetical protein
MKYKPNYKHRFWSMSIVSVMAIALWLGTTWDRNRLYKELEVALAPMDCTWEAWENRSITDETKFIDRRERAVAKCVQFTVEQADPLTACERYRWRIFDKVIESELDMAYLALDMIGNAHGAGQCEAFDGTYWFDNGAWLREAIRAQEMLISWLESNP